jgi:hypothetical protein
MTERPDATVGEPQQPRKRESDKQAALLYLPNRLNKDLSHVATELGLTRSDLAAIAIEEYLARYAHLIRRM